MSDVIVTVVESNTNVTVTEQDVAVAVTENTVEVSASTAGIQGIPGANTDPIYVTVRNATGATLAKGTLVYISGSNGNHVQVTPAIATSDATSARTLGWLAASIANNASGLCQIEGYLEGLNTQGLTSGSQLYLSGTTAGAFTATKPQAPIHLVYVGVVTKISAGDGHVFVKVQNGYELGELHDVLITSPTNAQVLAYDSATSLWKNATNTPDGVTSITATAPLTGGTITSTGSIGLDQTALSITKSQVSDFTSGTVTSAGTAQQAGTAVYSVNSGTAVYSTTSGTAVYSVNSGTAVTISGNITRSQVSDFTSGTVAQADNSTTSGTATYATTSGTAVSISGSITRSQVSDFTSGTVASADVSGTATYATTSGTAVYATNSGTAVFATNASTAVTISGSITQSQVTSLVTDLAGKASLGAANAFTVGGHVITNAAIGVVPLVLKGASGQTADFFQIQNNSATNLINVTSAGNLNVTGQVRVGTTSSLGQLTTVIGGASTIGAVIRGAASQTADLLQIQNSAGTNLVRADTYGGLFSTYATFTSDAAATRPLLVKGASGQTANLQEWQTSAGTVRARIDSGGNFKAFNLASNNSALQIFESNSGGAVLFGKATAQASSPGSGFATMYFRDGTNAGTLKLVVRAGASGAETTILDNIPQT